MHPLLYQTLHIDWYPALVLLGYFAGWLVARTRAKRAGIEPRHIDNLVLLILITGLVGARLAARLFYAPNISFIDSFKVWRGGGLVFYGGFIAGTLTVLIYAWKTRLPIAKILDVFAPGAALGLAFGRIGCFMAGCCFGDICGLPANHVALDPQVAYQVRTIPALSPRFLGVQFPIKSDAFQQHQKLGLLEPTSTKSLPVHPVQLYEAVFAALRSLVASAQATVSGRNCDSHARGIFGGAICVGIFPRRQSADLSRHDDFAGHEPFVAGDCDCVCGMAGSGRSSSIYTTSSQRPNLKPTFWKRPTSKNPQRACRRTLASLLASMSAMIACLILLTR